MPPVALACALHEIGPGFAQRAHGFVTKTTNLDSAVDQVHDDVPICVRRFSTKLTIARQATTRQMGNCAVGGNQELYSNTEEILILKSPPSRPHSTTTPRDSGSIHEPSTTMEQDSHHVPITHDHVPQYCRTAPYLTQSSTDSASIHQSVSLEGSYPGSSRHWASSIFESESRMVT